jgi:hypothetical protein
VDYKDETFEGVEVELDGNTFERCSFNDVLFKYSGGDIEMKDCKIERFSFVFGGQLANGLYALLQLFGVEGMLQIIRGFTQPGDGKEIELSPPTQGNA